MDFETLFQAFVHLFKEGGGNSGFVFYAALTAILTQIMKKLFVDKAKVVLLHKFNLAQVLPYIFGLGFAIFDLFVVKKPIKFEFQQVYTCVVEAVSIGAISGVFFDLISSLSGHSLTTLLKNNAFEILYTQLVNFSQLSQKIKTGEVKLVDAVQQIQQASQVLTGIYKGEGDDTEKMSGLKAVLTDMLDIENSEELLKLIDSALRKTFDC